MNERIEKLAEQAKVHVLARIDEDDSDWDDQHTVLYNQKFAELIVRECTYIIANQAWESRTTGSNGDWTEYNTLSRVAGQIKEHFGVEE